MGENYNMGFPITILKVLFKALMLYARENNKGVYDRYNRSSQHRHDDELRD